MSFSHSYSIGGFLWLIGFALYVIPPVADAQSPSLPDPLKAGWKGKPVCEHLYEDTQKRILRCTFPPGVGHERHYHAPHFGYATEGGRMRITAENSVREVDLSTGSSYTSEGVEWHEVVNIGNTTVSYLIIEGKEEFVKPMQEVKLSLE